MLRPTIVESVKREVQEIKEAVIGGIRRGRENIVEAQNRRVGFGETQIPQS